MPIFVALSWVTVIMGVLFFQTGRATDLGAEAQTGADATALAAAEDIRNQIIEYFMSGGYYRGPFVLNQPRALAAGQLYAARNDVDARISFQGFDLQWEVSVTATTERELTPIGGGTDPETGEPRGFPVGDGERGVQEAVARVGGGTAFTAAGFSLPGAPGGGGGGATTSAGSCPIPTAELDDLAGQAGVPVDFARDSALTRYTRCDGPGVSVSGLTDAMKISLLRLEAAIGEPLTLNSAYRSPAYQAQLCLRVAGPCAPPGRSLHGDGLAVDVGNWQAAARAVSQDPSIGLCQPLPANDAVHFSHVTGRECGGRTGATNGGATGGSPSPLAFGGAVTVGAWFDVALVE